MKGVCAHAQIVHTHFLSSLFSALRENATHRERDW